MNVQEKGMKDADVRFQDVYFSLYVSFLAEPKS